MNPILDSLNDQQRAAVLAKDGPVLIIAGAGSGKTRVITSRIALLLQEGEDPHGILALTFTKKAASEMRSRIRRMAGDAAGGLVMGTFHSVFVRFLREYHAWIGFKSNFTIYDEDDSASCLRNCIMETLFGQDWNNKELNKFLTDEQKKYRKRLTQIYKVKEVASRISRLKNDYIMPKDYRESSVLQREDAKQNRPKLGDIYELYMKRCRGANALDFDDILVYTYFLMERFPDVATAIARRFHYILVDEYQDTNAIQYDIVLTLSGAYGNVCAVGDDSQSVYAFRGARIENILNFEKDFPDCRKFKLETNYRSTPQIVNAANRLIENNKVRLPKHCVASRGNGLPIDVQYLRNDREEARYIAKVIRERHGRDKVPYAAHAVLYRTNAQARALEDALMRERIPYVIYSGMSFFERQEVKDVIAYMRLVVNHDDDEAFKRICNRPARGISEPTLTTLQAGASRNETSLYATAANTPYDPVGLKAGPVNSLTAFCRLINELTAETAGANALEATQAILEKTGIYEHYSKENDDDGRKRTNNIDELLRGIQYYLEDQRSGDTDDLPDESLAAYLMNIALLTAVDEKRDSDADRVSLMTSHCSKGLEFPTVFIAGCEEGLYPSVRDESTPFELEEERRLFYVSVTRAMNELILTVCDNRWRYGETEPCIPSRFIDEMFED